MGTLYELATGGSSRDGRSGGVADTYIRKFKYIKSSPSEGYSLPNVTGIYVGAPYPGDANCTCVSIDDSPEGESRLVRNFTYTYKTVANTSGPQQQQQPPDVRPPNYSFQFGLDYVATQSWIADPVANGGWATATTPNGEIVTGLEKPQATAVLRVKQFVTSDPAGYCEYVGTVNDGLFTAGSFSAIARTLLFRGIDAQPAVETYNLQTYAGWNVTYEFAYRENFQMINSNTAINNDNQSLVNIGWDKAVPLSSRNVWCSTAAGNQFLELTAFPLEHNKNGAIKSVNDGSGPINGQYFWAADPNGGGGTVQNTLARAMVTIPAVKGGFTQVPASEPRPVNLDGSPRKSTLRPIVHRRGFHKEINFKVTLGLRN